MTVREDIFVAQQSRKPRPVVLTDRGLP